MTHPLSEVMSLNQERCSIDELLDIRINVDREIKTRAKQELDKLEVTRNKLLGIIDSEWLEAVAGDTAPAKPADPKYRDPVTGKTWSGKGKRPKWFDARRTEDFLI